MTLLIVDAEVRARVARMAHLSGSDPDDQWDYERDSQDAAGLAAAMEHLTAAYDAVRTSNASAKVVKAVEDQVIKRAARVIVEEAWEVARHRRGEGPVLSNKYTYGAAWSPAALDLLLNADGTPAPDAAWKGKLTLEHVVPAKTIVLLLSAMGKQGADGATIAAALRETVTHVIVANKATKASGCRDEPQARNLPPQAEQRLLAHYTGGERMDEATRFETIWVRYLDPQLRGDMDWTLEDLSTVWDEQARRRATV